MGRPNRELQRLLRDNRDGLERAGAREDWRTQVDALSIVLPKDAITEQQKADNRTTLAGTGHGGFDLAVANGVVKALPAGSTVTRPVTIREDCVIDGVEFVANEDTSNDVLITVTNGASVLFRNCLFRGSTTMSVSFIVVDTGSCMFTGCYAYGTTTATAIIDNQPGTVMTVAWLDSMNVTGVALGEVVDSASPAWCGGAAGAKVLTSAADLVLSTLHDVVLLDTFGGNVTATLPPAAGYAGYRFTVKKITGGNNAIIDGDGVETIDGGGNITWALQWEVHTVISDGTSWYEVSDG